MKKIILLLFIFAHFIGMSAQKKPIYIPGKGHIDVERLNQPLDLNMNLSQLSLSELRVVRNAIAARQGYCFKSADLRHLFGQTTWYDSLMMKRCDDNTYEAEEGYSDYEQEPVKYTQAERDFLERIRREQYTRKENLPSGCLVNPDNMLNPFQLDSMNPKLTAALGRNGFAIVPSHHLQLFHVYEKNDYFDFPSFVTTDLYLQLFHFYFDCVLKDIEEEKFDSLLTTFSQGLYAELSAKPKSAEREWDKAYAAISIGLLTGQTPAVPKEYQQQVADEMAKIERSANDFSPFLGYKEVYFSYALFRPRGHYTRSEKMKRYFRAMMWLQTAPFEIENDEQLRRAALLAETVNGSQSLRKSYEDIFNPMTFLMGEPDNVTLLQMADEMGKNGASYQEIVKNREIAKQLQTALIALAKQQTRIVPKFQHTSPWKINLMPQRYQPDVEVLNEMIDARNNPTRRGVPKALDVMAALGSHAADSLLDEMGENRQWEDFTMMLDSMKCRMQKGVDWEATICNRWLNMLKVLNDTLKKNDKTPYFMVTPAWSKKNLNTTLASYAELKHDAILYAKQPAAAECGAGGPPDPVVKEYVEPNLPFWKKAVSLMEEMEDMLDRYHLWTEKARTTTIAVKEQAELLMRISDKELRGERLTDEDCSQLEHIGATFEYISLDLARSKDQELMGWDDIQSADKNVACVADVYTANGDNNPNHTVLYEAVGPVNEIYVLVNMDGDLYLTRGAVLSYREFQQPTTEQRLTDEEWQKKLKEHSTLGIPKWMDDITVPLEQQPQENEEISYSSGC